MSTTLAPIVVFAYKRADHLKKVFDALKLNALASQSDLYVYCDGPKRNDDLDKINQVRELSKKQTWCKKLEVIERPTNFGLSKSITTGVTEIIKKYGKIIVLEDDQVVAPTFLEFCNQALEKYKDNTEVMQITGYMYPVETKGSDDAFFICHSSCWGWATWERAWKQFNTADDQLFFQQVLDNKDLKKKFDMDHAYPYSQMLKQKLEGGNDSWGISWYISLFKNSGLILMPRQSLVANIGRDNSATHKGREVFKDTLSEKSNLELPPQIKVDENAYRDISVFLRRLHVPWYKKILFRFF